jgi:peptide/nickel transport system permease protein
MFRQVGQRLLWLIPTLVIVSFLIFLLFDLAPGDPARSVAGEEATEAQLQEVREELKLDDPLLTRYTRWISDAAQGDLGNSIKTREPVVDLVFDSLPPTLSLVAVSMVFSVIAALVLGTASTLYPNTFVTRGASFLSAALIAIPSFWIGLLLVSAFALDRDWFPAVGYVDLTQNPWEWFEHLVLPSLALAGLAAGELARQLQSSLSDVMNKDYVTALRAKGNPERGIVLKHGLKNAAVPVVTVLGVRIAQLIGGTVLVERVFAIDGMGSLTLNAVLTRDIPVVLGVVLVSTIIVLVLNLLVDISYVYFNPKVRTT